MASGSLPQSLSIHGTSAINGGQSFAGVNLGTVNYAGSDNKPNANEHAAIECRKALFLTDPHVDRESLISAKGSRVAGTCEWITSNESYQAWLHGDDDEDGNSSKSDNTRLLWISGGPGKGKTMLSVFLTEELERHTASLDNAELAFFFCSSQDNKRNTAVAVLRGLVHQIIAKRPQLVKHALPYFETPERTQQSLSSLETLWIIFSKLVSDAGLGKMFCVLDGIDECEDSMPRALLPRIVGLLASTTPSRTRGRFKLAIVSRNMPGLQGCARVRLDPDNDEKVVSDIELFVSARVGELSGIEGFNNEFQASMRSALLQRAEGTFLWVGFVMHELSQKQTCTEILEALEELPSGLPAVYSHMMQRIPAQHRVMSREILSWATLAVRPLRLGELAAALDLLAPSSLVALEQATRDAITHCGPLLKVTGQEVSLVHQSARDYLLRKDHDCDAVLEEFRLDQQRVHLQLAQRCLDCIAQSDLQHRVIDPTTEPDPQEPPLLRYAALYWPEHAERCSALAAKLLDPYGLFLQEKSSLRIHWWSTYLKMTSVHPTECPPLLHTPLLHMACMFENIPWIEAILAKRSWRPRFHRRIDKKDGLEMTALHYAAHHGNEAAVRLLLDKGADINAKNNYKDTALHYAARHGNETMVWLLVDRGADINVQSYGKKTALHFAADQGNKAVMQLLVDSGADINAKDNWRQTALHSAADQGNKAVTRLLVDSGADINAKDTWGKTALHSAAKQGNEAVMRLLVDSGADINAKDISWGIALHNAAYHGNEAVVRLLIDRGADINAKDIRGRTALHSAAHGGNEAVVRLLAEKGADLEVKEWLFGRTVLRLAACQGNQAVVQLLIDHGADVQAKDNEGRAALDCPTKSDIEIGPREQLMDEFWDFMRASKY